MLVAKKSVYIETTIPSLIASRPSRDIEDPIEEVYRIRQEILEEHGGIKGWNKHLDEVRPKYEAMGFKFLTEAEYEALKNRHS